MPSTTDASNLFTSARLTYRGIEPTDDPFIHSINQDPAVFVAANGLLPRPVIQKWSSERMRTFLAEKAMLGVLICLRSTEFTEKKDQNDAKKVNEEKGETPIGFVCLNNPEESAHHRNAMLGISIVSAYQGKGYGTEVLAWALEWAFDIAGMHRVELRVLGWNEGARRLYERVGFVQEGRKRKYLWYKGAWWDEFLMGMLEEEWRARQASSKEG